MTKRLMVIILFLWGGQVFAQDMDLLFPLWETQMTQWIAEHPEGALADLTMAEVAKMYSSSRLNEARRRFVETGVDMSFKLPGFGHFRAGDNLKGSLFAGGAAVLLVGGVYLAVQVLPGYLRSYNFFVYPWARTELEFKAYSPMDYLPSMITMGVTGVSIGLLGYISAMDARPLLIARAQASGWEFLSPGSQGMLFGGALRY